MGRSWKWIALAVLLMGAGDPRADRFDTVVIDPGHGGEDHGATGNAGLHEKDLVLDVSRRLAEELRSHGIHVVMTRESDRFVSLERRTSVANDARGDLFVSIHANASASDTARGTETFFASLDASDEAAGALAARENQSFSDDSSSARQVSDPLLEILGDLIATEHLDDSSEFARLAQKKLARTGAMPSRGVKQAPFVVLMGVQMPAALVEIGFLTNSADEQSLRSRESHALLAQALAKAVLEFGRHHDVRRGLGVDGSLAGRAP